MSTSIEKTLYFIIDKAGVRLPDEVNNHSETALEFVWLNVVGLGGEPLSLAFDDGSLALVGHASWGPDDQPAVAIYARALSPAMYVTVRTLRAVLGGKRTDLSKSMLPRFDRAPKTSDDNAE